MVFRCIIAIIGCHYTRLWQAWNSVAIIAIIVCQAWFWIISRLFAFGRWHSVAIIACHYTRLWHAWFWWNNANNAKTEKKSSCSTRPNGVSLYAVMCDYFTIMRIIAITAIIAIILIHQKSDNRLCLRVSMVWAKQTLGVGNTTHRGYHGGEELESQRLDQLGRSLTWTCGSWDLHTVFQPIRGVCDERRWHAVNQTRY
jgi:hypothetical protein